MAEEIVFYFLLFVVAFLYSSVGHGGASGYLALMTLFSFAPETMRPTALMLNVLVSAIAFIQFYRKDFFQWKLFWPFAVTSIPAAFLGGMISVEETLYKKILAVLLLFSVVRLVGFNPELKGEKKQQNLALSLFLGAIIGLFSGMIGIGGGIILSPLILLLNWANLKQTAAVSALFIFVNSIAGLIGLFSKGITIEFTMIGFLLTAFFGGLIGSYFGAAKFNSVKLKYILAVVLWIASIKLFFT
jgi:uncharacterized membrane protein YfcA